jgi:hydrogenase expression/formation protein HypE
MDARILLDHGEGGAASARLVREVFLAHLGAPAVLEDAAVVEGGARLALTTDSFVVRPRFFPGGDVGKLAVCGTVNDLAVMGAVPRYLTCGFILEEGLPVADLERVVASMAAAAREAGVSIVAGDTKVVGHGEVDGLFVNTSGVGFVPAGRALSAGACRPGDAILVSGPVGDHGTAVMLAREGFGLETDLVSDCQPLADLAAALLAAAPGTRCMRDPTRGGLATTLNEIARQSGVGMRLQEAAIPVKPQVEAACELLGLDPLYVANEGKLVAIVAPEAAEAALAALRAHPLGASAARIGQVQADAHHFVQMDTRFGGRRVVDWLSGEQLPRIC